MQDGRAAHEREPAGLTLISERVQHHTEREHSAEGQPEQLCNSLLAHDHLPPRASIVRRASGAPGSKVSPIPSKAVSGTD